jgi:ferric-dicitrate binding protein FerR (iron transport regulator)
MEEDILQEAWRTAELLAKFLRNELTVEETEELDNWIAKSRKNQVLFEELTDEKNLKKAKQWFLELEKKKAQSLASVKTKIPFEPARKKIRPLRWFIAAATITAVIYGGWSLLHNRNVEQKTKDDLVIRAGDVAPGGDRAVLEISNGTSINLNDQQNGSVIKEQGALISKTGDGEIRYENIQSDQADIPFNKLITPRGGQYRITLPDGSRAWLNALSSLSYPVSFKNSRSVEVTGEVYFEVKKDKVPFIVQVKGTNIEVLGTHFNVNAYNLVQTTLFEGSVKINDDKLLRPGEQAIAGNEIKISRLEYPDDIVAWKNGYFRFTHESIQDIMDQLGRWYNINVRFEANLPQSTFTATAKRNENISTILKNIEQAGHIHFKIEGEQITVMP